MTPDEMKAAVGRETLSDWIPVTQQMIQMFADATGDHQFIHLDPERAKTTRFGTTVAHGFLTLSLLPLIWANDREAARLEPFELSVNYGLNRVRFLAPVPSGARVRGRSKIIEFAEKRPGQYQYTAETVIEIEGEEKPAMIAEWITQIFV